MCESPFCTAALHTFCCDPPFDEVPEGSWFCPMHAVVEKIFCGVCAGGENDDLMLLCDAQGCKNGYHMYCLNPVLTQVPDGEWLCPHHDGSNGASAASQPGLPPPVNVHSPVISSAKDVPSKVRCFFFCCSEFFFLSINSASLCVHVFPNSFS